MAHVAGDRFVHVPGAKYLRNAKHFTVNRATVSQIIHPALAPVHRIEPLRECLEVLGYRVFKIGDHSKAADARIYVFIERPHGIT